MSVENFVLEMPQADALEFLLQTQAMWQTPAPKSPVRRNETAVYCETAGPVDSKAVRTRRSPAKPRSTTARDPLAPHVRCRCEDCKTCKDNARWDQIFARMAGEYRPDERGLFGSTLRGL
jgi:hypothetical protein